MISEQVKTDVRAFIAEQLPAWKDDAIEFNSPDDGEDEYTPYMDITFAISEDGTAWNYQTGDNCYTGGAYGLPHWAVSTIDADTTADSLLDDVVGQWLDLMYQQQHKSNARLSTARCGRREKTC